MAIVGLLGTVAAGASAGMGSLDEELAYFATPWIGGAWDAGAVALQVPLRFMAAQGALRETDWDERRDFGRLLRIARYGKRGDRSTGHAFELHLGLLTDRTLGHGTLVRRYHNGVDDDHHRTGAAASLFSPEGGAEVWADQVLGPPVVAGRAYAVLSDRLTIGLTFAADSAAPEAADGTIDPQRRFDGPTAFRPLYGVDMEIRLAGGSPQTLGLVLYSDLNRVAESDAGLHAGARIHLPVGRRGSVDTWLEVMRLGQGYDWAYLDAGWLTRRWTQTAYEPKRFESTTGGRLAIEARYADALVVGAQYADALQDGRADLSVWAQLPMKDLQIAAFYLRRHPDQRYEVLHPGCALGAVAARMRLDGAWWMGATLARVWRLKVVEPSYGQLRPVTEASATMEMAWGL